MNNTIVIQDESSLSADMIRWTSAANDWLGNLNSERTRTTYLAAWKHFLGFIACEPASVTQSDVIAYKSNLADSGKSDSTINLKLSALSSFYNVAVQQALVDANPCAGVKRLSVKPYTKTTYLSSNDNQDKLLLKQPDKSTQIGKRDYAILLLLLTTGVRVSALVNASISSVKPSATGYTLAYINKRGNDESAEVLPFVYEALQEYLSSRDDESNCLFVTVASNRTGKAIKPLSRHAITAMVSRYAKQASLHHITAHSLRHTAAMIAAETGTVAQVKAFLRHTSIRTTAIYLDHVGDDDVRDMTQAVGGRYA